MKYTSLFSAVAVAAAMGTSAFATVDTNNTTSINFEGESYPLGSPSGLTGWTVQTDDQSAIVYAPLEAASTNDVAGDYTANKLLMLNTEGQELKWTPANMSTNKAIIEMKVRLVASDTAPAISDTDVHAAVYLKVADGDDHTDDGLYAYATVNGTNAWQKLDTSAFNTNLETGSTVALRVVMDYDENVQTVTYEGALLPAADPVYYPLGVLDMANPDITVKKLTSVSFKGTGSVDDLFVGEIVTTPSTATISANVFDEADMTNPVQPIPAAELDVVKDPPDTYEGVVRWNNFVEGSVVKSVALYELTTNGNETVETSLSWANEPAIASSGAFSVTTNNYMFVAEHTYLIKIVVGEPEASWTVTFMSDGQAYATTNVLGGTPVVAPSPAPTKQDNEFGGWYEDNNTFQVAYDFTANVTNDLTLYAKWTATSSGDLTAFSIGDASQTLPQGVESVVVENGKFIVNVVEPTGATASLIGASTLTGSFTDVEATRTVKTGYTELSYTIPADETAKFFKVKFTK